MRFFIAILLIICGFNLNAQILDSILIDNNSTLNKYESDFLNDYFKLKGIHLIFLKSGL